MTEVEGEKAAASARNGGIGEAPNPMATPYATTTATYGGLAGLNAGKETKSNNNRISNV